MENQTNTTQPTAEPPTYGSDVGGLEKAAREVTEARETPPPPAEPIDQGETAIEGPGDPSDKRQPPVSLDKSVSLRMALRSYPSGVRRSKKHR